MSDRNNNQQADSKGASAKRFKTAKPIGRIVEHSKCPKCGNEFHCSTSSKCWCFEYDVPADTMEQLQQEFDGCLCPDCLREYTRYQING